MPKISLILGDYRAKSIIAEAQRCVNLFGEPNPKDSETPFTFYPTPGLKLLGSAFPGSSGGSPAGGGPPNQGGGISPTPSPTPSPSPPPPVAVTLDPVFTGPGLTLSNGDLTCTAASGGPGFSSITMSTTGKSSGKWYFEVTCVDFAGPNNEGWGIANHSAVLFNPLGWNTNGIEIRSNIGQVATNYGASTGDNVIAVCTGINARNTTIAYCCIDATAKLIWFASSANDGSSFSGWNSVFAGNPVTGANGFGFSNLGSGPFYAALSLENATEWTINFGATPFVGTIPAGFTAWKN